MTAKYASVISVISVIVITLCNIAWTSGMAAMKFALTDFSALQIMAARVACPALFYLCLFSQWSNISIRPRDIKFFILLAICEPCLFFFCITNAMRYASATEESVIAALLPLFITAGACLILREKMSGKSFFWLLAALAAVLGIIRKSHPSFNASNPLLGNSFMLAGAIFSAGFTLLARKLSQNYPGVLIPQFRLSLAVLFSYPSA